MFEAVIKIAVRAAVLCMMWLLLNAMMKKTKPIKKVSSCPKGKGAWNHTTPSSKDTQ